MHLRVIGFTERGASGEAPWSFPEVARRRKGSTQESPGEVSRSFPEIARRRKGLPPGSPHDLQCGVRCEDYPRRRQRSEGDTWMGENQSQNRCGRHRYGGPEGDCQGIRDEGDGHEQESCWICCDAWQRDQELRGEEDRQVHGRWRRS